MEFKKELQKLYSTKDVGLGVITNGVEYRFFTDLDDANIMEGSTCVN